MQDGLDDLHAVWLETNVPDQVDVKPFHIAVFNAPDAPLPQILPNIFVVHILIIRSGGLLQFVLGLNVCVKVVVQRGLRRGISMDVVLSISGDALLQFPKSLTGPPAIRALIRTTSFQL